LSAERDASTAALLRYEDRRRRCIRRLRERLRQILGGGRCVACSREDYLEFAHLRPTGVSGRSRGSWETLADVRRHLRDYVLLCDDCHKNFDKGRPIGGAR